MMKTFEPDNGYQIMGRWNRGEGKIIQKAAREGDGLAQKVVISAKIWWRHFRDKTAELDFVKSYNKYKEGSK